MGRLAPGFWKQEVVPLILQRRRRRRIQVDVAELGNWPVTPFVFAVLRLAES